MSNWQDTVIKDPEEMLSHYQEIDKETGIPYERLDRLLEAQAEISFRAGIKEVVEWIKQCGDYIGEDGVYLKDVWLLPGDKWQAKLKEWGMEMKDG